MSSPIHRWQIVSTVAILDLSIVSALLGLLRPDHYGEAFLPQYYAQDATILVVGVPALALGLRSAIRGSIRGRIVWLGALAYMNYMWASIGLQVGFNRFFLGYVVLFGLSLFTFVGGMVSIETGAIDRSFPDDVPERLYGGFLVAIALGLATLWLAELVPATVTGTPPALVEEQGPQALVSHFLDLGVIVPSMAIAGVRLWRRRPWGYVLAGVGLVFRRDSRPVHRLDDGGHSLGWTVDRLGCSDRVHPAARHRRRSARRHVRSSGSAGRTPRIGQRTR